MFLILSLIAQHVDDNYQKATLAFPCKLFYALFPRTSQRQVWTPVHDVSCGTVSTALSRLAVQSSSPRTGTLYLLVVCLCKGVGRLGTCSTRQALEKRSNNFNVTRMKKKSKWGEENESFKLKTGYQEKMWQACRKSLCAK